MIWSLFVQHRLGKAFRAQAAQALKAWEVSEPATGATAMPDPGAPRMATQHERPAR